MTRAATLPRARRVLMTTDCVGGVWTYAVHLTRELCARGARVTLANMGPRPSDAQRREVAAIAGARLVESDFKLEWMDDPWQDVDRASEWLLRLAHETRADVVHLNGYSHAHLPFGVPVCVVAHSCVCSWWQAVLGEPAPARYAEYRARVAQGLSAATRVVAPTGAMLIALAEQHCVVGRGVVIPNGIPLEALRSEPKQRTVLGAGRVWDQAKNLSTLARAAASVEADVRIAGEVGDAQVAAFANVQFLGCLPSSAVRREMAAASIFAHPARYEPFGLAPLEAAVQGCALVLGDIASLREVWGDAALFVPPDDAGALSRTLAELLEQPRRRAELALRAHERALRYSIGRTARSYMNLYEGMLGGAEPRARASAPAYSEGMR